MTLHNIVDDILLTISYIDSKKVENIEQRQVEYWVDLYRLILLRQDINDNSLIDPTYISTIQVKMLLYPSEIRSFTRLIPHISKEQLPRLPILTGRFAILSLRKPFNPKQDLDEETNPMEGFLIPIHEWGRLRYMDCDRYNPSIMRATIKNKHLLVYSTPNIPWDNSSLDPTADNLECELILASPAEYYQKLNVEIPFRDTPYPLPDEKLPRLKQMIFANELQWVLPPQMTMQSAQMAKMEEKDMTNNPAALMEQGADLYENLA